MIFVLSMLVLFPLLLLCPYTHPQADDYTLAVRAEQRNFPEDVVRVYERWSGRYSATALSRLNPLLDGDPDGAGRGAALVILATVWALYFAVKRIFVKISEMRENTALAAFFVLVYFALFPSPAEGMYWFSGYITYQAPVILTLFLWALLQWRTGKKAGIWSSVVPVLLVILISGFNLVSLMVLFFLLGWFILQYYMVYRKFSRFYAILLILGLASGLVFTLSPGHFRRMEGFPFSGNLLLSVSGAAVQTIWAFVRWGIPLALSSALYIRWWGGRMVRVAQDRENRGGAGPLTMSLLFTGMLFLLYFVYAWVTGSRPTGRVDNVVFVFFLAGWFWCLEAWVQNRSHSRFFRIVQRSYVVHTSGILLLLWLFFPGGNVTQAWSDLLTGEAKAYDRQLKDRYRMIRACEEDTCMVAGLTAMPRMLYFRDLAGKEAAENTYINRSFARYYGVTAVVADPPAPPAEYRSLPWEGRLRKWRQKWFAPDAFMEKLRRGKACRDPNPSLTGLCLSGTQTGSLRRPWRIFPRIFFHIKPSEASPFEEIRKEEMF
ncbi:MAG TPA: hypothetical protein ENN63_09175 [Bacteroidetes bacterium]|nr:hypothetical protein [Bacteroidota bacterium]